MAFRLSCLANSIPVTLACVKCPVDITSMTNNNLNTIVVPINNRIRNSQLLLYVGKGRSYHRRKLKENALYKINNWAGKNDKQFKQALEYLKGQEVIPDFSKIIERYYRERHAVCYKSLERHHGSCAIYNCKQAIISDPTGGSVIINRTIA